MVPIILAGLAATTALPAPAPDPTPLWLMFTIAHVCVAPAVAGRKNHDNYKSWEYEDAHLTEFGWKQVRQLMQTLA